MPVQKCDCGSCQRCRHRETVRRIRNRDRVYFGKVPWRSGLRDEDSRFAMIFERNHGRAEAEYYSRVPVANSQNAIAAADFYVGGLPPGMVLPIAAAHSFDTSIQEPSSKGWIHFPNRRGKRQIPAAA